MVALCRHGGNIPPPTYTGVSYCRHDLSNVYISSYAQDDINYIIFKRGKLFVSLLVGLQLDIIIQRAN